MATEYSALHTTRPWQPGFLRRIPWAGLSSLVGALIGIGAAIAILITSNGVPIREWKYAPTVYLSVCYTISNILLNAALSQGVTVCTFCIRDSIALTRADHLVEESYGNGAIG